MNIKKLIKKIALKLPSFQGLCRFLTRKHIRVVMYHRFAPDHVNNSRLMNIGVFDKQLSYIKKHHQFWAPSKQLNALNDPSAITFPPPVCITVDDGYSDFFELAFPLLKNFSAPAILFVTTGFISGQIWFWWDRLAYILDHAETGLLDFSVAGKRFSGNLADIDQRSIIWNSIADHLSVQGNDKKETALLSLASECQVSIPENPPPEFSPATWDQIRLMSDNNIVMGAHTITHPILSRVDSDSAWKEISESRKELEDNLGTEVSWFCYPSGCPRDFLPETVEMVKKAGFQGCYVAFPNALHDGDPYTLPRYSAPHNFTQFQWMMCGAEHLARNCNSWFTHFSERF